MEKGTNTKSKEKLKTKKIVYDYLVIKSLMKGKILKAERLKNNYWCNTNL